MAYVDESRFGRSFLAVVGGKWRLHIVYKDGKEETVDYETKYAAIVAAEEKGGFILY